MLLSSYAVIIFFWNSAWVQPLKLIVVMFHEISHALGALFTGGKVMSILISWDESGYTVTRGGNFLTIASAGYIGSILFGSLMLHFSLKGKWHSSCSIGMGALVAFFTFMYCQKVSPQILFLLGNWSLLLILTAIFLKRINRYILLYMGGITNLYGLFDLSDFFRGAIAKTDAGKIAHHYAGEPVQEKLLAYAIAVFISVISIWIAYKIVSSALSKELAESAVTEEPAEPPPSPSPIDPALLDPVLLEQIRKGMLDQEPQTK